MTRDGLSRRGCLGNVSRPVSMAMTGLLEEDTASVSGQVQPLRDEGKSNMARGTTCSSNASYLPACLPPSPFFPAVDRQVRSATRMASQYEPDPLRGSRAATCTASIPEPATRASSVSCRAVLLLQYVAGSPGTLFERQHDSTPVFAVPSRLLQ